MDGRVKTIRWDGFPHPDRALNANTYPKGAWVLHMLRGELGDARFFAALRYYYNRYRGTSVSTRDFVRAVESASGQKLGWFFDQWLDRVGCPILEVTSKSEEVVVTQHQGGAPYRFRLRLAWKTADGEAKERVFRITDKRQRLPLQAAKDLRIDPKVELLYRPKS